MQKIFCVEDDESILGLLLYVLKNGGYDAYGFETADALFSNLDKNESPDLFILDVMLPGEDGFEILRKIKNSMHYTDIPVIMLTAKTSEEDKVKGLDLGADDYVTKPFGVAELLSRVRAVLRRSMPKSDRNTQSSSEQISVYGIVMDVSRRRVEVNGEDVELTFKEFELLLYMIKNEGIALSREKILSSVWGYDFDGGTRTVDAHITMLRRHLKDAGEHIHTIRGVGYRFGE